MRYIKLFESFFNKNKTQIPTEEALRMLDINVFENLSDYFLEDEFWSKKVYTIDDQNYEMGECGIDAWFFNEKNGQLNGHIANFEFGGIIPWPHNFTDKDKDSIIGYRVWIELNDRYQKIPDQILNRIQVNINRIEKNEKLKFFMLMIRNYNWDKYKTQYLFSKNLEDFKKYEGDVVSFGLFFKKI